MAMSRVGKGRRVLTKKIIALIALFLASAAAVILIVAPNIAQKSDIDNNSGQVGNGQEKQPESEPEPIDLVKEQLDAMTLDEKVAQLLIVENKGQIISETDITRLKTAPYGGYILMEGNYSTLTNTRAFVEELQNNAKTQLIISTDHEGGLVQRIAKITDRSATYIPDMYRLGSTKNEGLAREVGRIMAEEMRTIGINVDFAPDADVFSNPYNPVIGNRSFSEDSQVVARMSAALAAGMESNGVVATYKHFPGHGDTATDSHLSLPIINRTRAELDACDLIPFKYAIQNGAKIIMTGHIALPNVTGDNTPATLSKKINVDILRTELGYDGLIVSDGMNMGALVNNYPESEIYYQAINAGIDMLILPSNPELAMQTIKQNVPEERIDEAVYRILKFKRTYLENYEYLDASYFGSTEHAQVVQRIP